MPTEGSSVCVSMPTEGNSVICLCVIVPAKGISACLPVCLSMSEMSPSHVSVKICSLSAQRLSKSHWC